MFKIQMNVTILFITLVLVGCSSQKPGDNQINENTNTGMTVDGVFRDIENNTDYNF